MAQQLQDSLTNFMSHAHRPTTASSPQLTAMIKKEMSLFEGGGARGKCLQAAYDCLLSIPPSSVESERAFSSAGTLCSKLRTRMADDTLDELVFTRSFLRNTKLRSKQYAAVNSPTAK